MAEYGKPLPVPDGDTAPYWASAREGRLAVQRCEACGRHVFYPRAVCPHCMSEQLTWVDATGFGTVYSYTVVHRAPAAFQGEAPYVVALVDLDEGVRLMSSIADPPGAVRIGDRVQVFFDPVTPEVTLPRFRLVKGGTP